MKNLVCLVKGCYLCDDWSIGKLCKCKVKPGRHPYKGKDQWRHPQSQPPHCRDCKEIIQPYKVLHSNDNRYIIIEVEGYFYFNVI